MRRTYRTARGFSLIELLVVIAIIAILAAILFPIMTAARAKARTTKCMNNMRQIGTAMLLYSDAYNGALPYPWNKSNWSIWWDQTWRERIIPYTKNKNVLLCPEPVYKRSTADTRNKKYISHYGMNIYVAYNTEAPDPGFRTLASIVLSTRTILVSENWDGDWSAEPWNNESTGGNEGKFWPYHGDQEGTKGGNFVYCDGHAGFLSVYQTQRDDFYLWKVIKK